MKCKAGPACTVVWTGKTSRLAAVANDSGKANGKLGGQKVTLLAAVGASMSCAPPVYNESLTD